MSIHSRTAGAPTLTAANRFADLTCQYLAFAALTPEVSTVTRIVTPNQPPAAGNRTGEKRLNFTATNSRRDIPIRLILKFGKW